VLLLQSASRDEGRLTFLSSDPGWKNSWGGTMRREEVVSWR